MSKTTAKNNSTMSTGQQKDVSRGITLKPDSHRPKNCVICFIESSLKMMKNAFNFILKAHFVLKIFKFLS